MTQAPPRGRVLVVEDDDEVRAALHDVLADHGWEVALAQDGEAGLELLRADPGGVAVVLVDLMMPRLGGAGFLKRKSLEPDLAEVPVIVVSAIPDMTPIPDTPDVSAVLRKPVATSALLDAVRSAAAAGAATRDAGPQA